MDRAPEDYVDLRRERRRQYDREYKRIRREERWQDAVGALHTVGCDGSHGRRANRYCKPIPVFQ